MIDRWTSSSNGADSETAGIQLFRDPEKAGKGVMTLIIPNIVATSRALAENGIVIDQIQTGEFGEISYALDPDGNTLTIAEPPNVRKG